MWRETKKNSGCKVKGTDRTDIECPGYVSGWEHTSLYGKQLPFRLY